MKAGGTKLWITELKRKVADDSRCLEFLCDVAAGRRVKIGPQHDPDRWHYPAFEERLQAATWIDNKILPDMKSQEITGDDGYEQFQLCAALFPIASQYVFHDLEQGFAE